MIGLATVQRHRSELARFLVVGAASALLNTAIIVALTEFFGLHYLVSYALCFVMVTLFGFTLNRNWSFSVAAPVQGKEMVRYYFTTIAGTALAMAASRVMVGLGLPYWLAVFLSAGVMAPLNFIIHRGWSFGLGVPR